MTAYIDTFSIAHFYIIFGVKYYFIN